MPSIHVNTKPGQALISILLQARHARGKRKEEGVRKEEGGRKEEGRKGGRKEGRKEGREEEGGRRKKEGRKGGRKNGRNEERKKGSNLAPKTEPKSFQNHSIFEYLLGSDFSKILMNFGSKMEPSWHPNGIQN